MLCCIVGITITFAADAAHHYGVAVREDRILGSCALLTTLDRWIPRCRFGHDYISCQHSDLSK